MLYIIIMVVSVVECICMWRLCQGSRGLYMRVMGMMGNVESGMYGIWMGVMRNVERGLM